MSRSESEYLFSYGTLQSESVQLATFARRLAGAPDALVGYEVVLIPPPSSAHATHHGMTELRNARFTGKASDALEGTRLEVTRAELEHADVYERSADYRRVRVTLRSGIEAWIY